LSLHLGEHQGTYRPWWNKIQVELFGWDSANAAITVKNKQTAPMDSIDVDRHMLSVEIADDPRGSDVEIRKVN
jgi:alpha-glucosidase